MALLPPSEQRECWDSYDQIQDRLEALERDLWEAADRSMSQEGEDRIQDPLT